MFWEFYRRRRTRLAAEDDRWWVVEEKLGRWKSGLDVMVMREYGGSRSGQSIGGRVNVSRITSRHSCKVKEREKTVDYIICMNIKNLLKFTYTVLDGSLMIVVVT